MSSSEDDAPKKVSKTSKSNSKKTDYTIKPSKGGAQLDTSTWPLLLKVPPPLSFSINRTSTSSTSKLTTSPPYPAEVPPPRELLRNSRDMESLILISHPIPPLTKSWLGLSAS